MFLSNLNILHIITICYCNFCVFFNRLIVSILLKMQKPEYEMNGHLHLFEYVIVTLSKKIKWTGFLNAGRSIKMFI